MFAFFIHFSYFNSDNQVLNLDNNFGIIASDYISHTASVTICQRQTDTEKLFPSNKP